MCLKWVKITTMAILIMFFLACNANTDTGNIRKSFITYSCEEGYKMDVTVLADSGHGTFVWIVCSEIDGQPDSRLYSPKHYMVNKRN